MKKIFRKSCSIFHLIFSSVESKSSKSGGNSTYRVLNEWSSFGSQNAVANSGWSNEVVRSSPGIGTNGHGEDLTGGGLSEVAVWKDLNNHKSILIIHIESDVFIVRRSLSFGTIWLETFCAKIVVTSSWGTITSLRVRVVPGVHNRVSVESINGCWFFGSNTEERIEPGWFLDGIVGDLSSRAESCVGVINLLLKSVSIWNSAGSNIDSGGSAVGSLIVRSLNQISLSAASASREERNSLSVKRESAGWETSKTTGGWINNGLPGSNFVRIILQPSDLCVIVGYSGGCSNFEVWSTFRGLDDVVANTTSSKSSKSDSSSITNSSVRVFSSSTADGFLEWASSKFERLGSKGVGVGGGSGSWKVIASPGSGIVDSDWSTFSILTGCRADWAAHGHSISSGVSSWQFWVVRHSCLSSTEVVSTQNAWTAFKSSSVSDGKSIESIGSSNESSNGGEWFWEHFLFILINILNKST